jgi:hypothetical protein
MIQKNTFIFCFPAEEKTTKLRKGKEGRQMSSKNPQGTFYYQVLILGPGKVNLQKESYRNRIQVKLKN